MLLPRYSLVLFSLFLINNKNVCNGMETSTESIFDVAARHIQQLKEEYNRDREQLKIDKENLKYEKELSEPVYETDVIHLNIGGEVIATTRQTLTSHSKSLLSILFNGRWERRLPCDNDGNIYLDFNQDLFRHLLDQLQLSPTDSISYPSDPSLVRPFEKMLKKLQLQLSLSPSNIITINIDGQIMTSKIFNPTTENITESFRNSKLSEKSDIFIDYQPRFFRNLIKLRRQNKSLKFECQKILFMKERTFHMKRTFKNWENICFKQGYISIHAKWNPNGITVAGGHGEGQALNQLKQPHGIKIDASDGTIVLVEFGNNRIVEWKKGATTGRIVICGNSQLDHPHDLIIDYFTNEFVIADNGNKRVVRCSRQSGTNNQTTISNIVVVGLAMKKYGDLYVVDNAKDEVRRWKTGDKEGTLVAGGNGRGAHLNQLSAPRYVFVDENESVYVSEWGNSRVTKWIKGVKEGIIVAGNHGQGSSLKQLHYPNEIFVDEMETVYIADTENHRIMRWVKGSTQGEVVVGGNGEGSQPNQLHYPINLVFDEENNFYVVDTNNHRVQKFSFDEKI